jgi:hypothetical protein
VNGSNPAVQKVRPRFVLFFVAYMTWEGFEPLHLFDANGILPHPRSCPSQPSHTLVLLRLAGGSPSALSFSSV